MNNSFDKYRNSVGFRPIDVHTGLSCSFNRPLNQEWCICVDFMRSVAAQNWSQMLYVKKLGCRALELQTFYNNFWEELWTVLVDCKVNNFHDLGFERERVSPDLPEDLESLVNSLNYLELTLSVCLVTTRALLDILLLFLWFLWRLLFLSYLDFGSFHQHKFRFVHFGYLDSLYLLIFYLLLIQYETALYLTIIAL